MRAMRRKDREVTNPIELKNILELCNICRIAYQDAEGLTIVPLNFGYVYDDHLSLYFHSAKAGRKFDAFQTPQVVAFEMDGAHRLIEGEEACDYSYSFVSIIGNGTISIVEDKDEKIKAIRHLMHHETKRDFEVDSNMANKVSIFRLDVSNFTGKYHP